jgi:adenylosuccinate synthase
VRYAARINGLDALALTKLDVLDGLDELKICTGYRVGGRIVTEFPADLAAAPYEAVYETVPGWKEPTRGARDFDELPAEARGYVARLEATSGVPIAIVSTGSDRDETIIRKRSIAEQWLAG